jgi:hypothetical protein
MTETPTQPDGTPVPGTPEANDLVVKGPDGDPLPHPDAVRMIEGESYERVIEGLKMAADACVHLAKMEAEHCENWKKVGERLDTIRRSSAELAGLDLPMKQLATGEVRGEPYDWNKARLRFLDGLRQATGGMRQIATCFRGDFRWSLKAQELERGHNYFRALLRGKFNSPLARAKPRLILPR